MPPIPNFLELQFKLILCLVYLRDNLFLKYAKIIFWYHAIMCSTTFLSRNNHQTIKTKINQWQCTKPNTSKQTSKTLNRLRLLIWNIIYGNLAIFLFERVCFGRDPASIFHLFTKGSDSGCVRPWDKNRLHLFYRENFPLLNTKIFSTSFSKKFPHLSCYQKNYLYRCFYIMLRQNRWICQMKY